MHRHRDRGPPRTSRPQHGDRRSDNPSQTRQRTAAQNLLIFIGQNISTSQKLSTSQKPLTNQQLSARQIFSTSQKPQNLEKEVFMDTRVAVIAIIIEKENAAEGVNNILHTYRRYIIGRMGIPYREKSINIISVAVDAPEPEITAMSGKIGRLDGVSTKTAYSKV